MGSTKRRAREQVKQMRAEQERQQRRKRVRLVVAASVAGALVIGLVVVAIVVRGGGGGTIEGVRTFEKAAGQHRYGELDYAQTPPAGGPHNPVWLNCGVYTEQIPSTNAVHSLEHGAVWVTYRPDLPEDQVQQLRDAVEGREYTILSPYEGLPSPVVASAWGKQLQLDSAGDSRLEDFLRAYVQGPQTPERGAACSNGTGRPAQG